MKILISVVQPAYEELVMLRELPVILEAFVVILSCHATRNHLWWL